MGGAKRYPSVTSQPCDGYRAAPPILLGRRALRLGAPQMFIQPRHDLDEIAGPRAVVELGAKDAVPAVAAGAGRTRQAEDISGARNAGGRPALDRRRADLG